MAKTKTFFLLIFCAVTYDKAVKSEQINIAENLITSIKAAENAMSLYNKEQDDSIPWKILNATIEAMGMDFGDYTSEAQRLISPIRQHLINGLQNYFEASQKVYEWTVFATPILSVYLDLIDNKELVINVLEDGVTKIGESITKLDNVVKEFDYAHNGFLALIDQLKADFKKTVEELSNNVVITRKVLYIGAGALTAVGSAFGGVIGFLGGTALSGIGGVPLGALGVKLGATGTAAVLSAMGIAGTAILITENEVANIREKMNFVEKFYTNSTLRVESHKISTVSTKEAIKEEQKKMIFLKGTTQSTRTFVISLTEQQRAIIVQRVRTLIELCNEFKRRHGGHDMMSVF